ITSCPAGTLFFVPGEACGPNSCNIACCAPNGSCVFATSWNACAWLGFSPAPVASGSVCTPNPCIQPACSGSTSCQGAPAPTAAGGLPAGVVGSSSDAVAVSGTNPGFNTADNFRAAATGNVTQLCFYGFFGGGGTF